jgi:hypothetical protein
MSIPLKEYQVGDEVEVHMQIGNDRKWRDAVVAEVKEQLWGGGPRHPPYTMVFVNTVRTYWDNIKEEWYDAPNKESYSYRNEIRLKSKDKF